MTAGDAPKVSRERDENSNDFHEIDLARMASTIKYSLFHMHFSDRLLEQNFGDEFSRSQAASSDIIWSISSTFLGALLVFRVREMVDMHIIIITLVNLAVSTVTNLTVFYLAKHHREKYIKIRTPLMLLTRSHRAFALKLLSTPRMTAAKLLLKLPQAPLAQALTPVSLQCLMLVIYSMGFRMVSFYQAPLTLFVTMLPLIGTRGLTCTPFTHNIPAAEAHYRQVVSAAKPLFHRLLPFSAFSNVAGAQCLVFCSWGLLAFGFWLPLLASNYAEERSRRAFLVRLGLPRPPKHSGWLVMAQMLGQLAVFALVSWGLIDGIAIMSVRWAKVK